MSEQRWFSSRVRVICLIEPEGGHDYMDSVFVFQSTDFDSAFTKALELGRKQESMYLNVENRQVVWKLKEIISLDVIDSETLDGVEVYSEHVNLNPGELIPFNTEFHPEQSQPTQTI
jgi:hypothetical protein